MAFLKPADFRNRLLIDVDGDTRPFGLIAEPWQRADFEALDEAWLQAVGYQSFDSGTVRRLWCERPRGHSKTSDIAVAVLWALAASRRKLVGVVAASDSDQARLVIQSIDRLIRANGSQSVKVQANRVINTRTRSECSIVTSDVGSSYGLLPDFIVADELTHWLERGQELWNSLLSSAAKRRTCLMLVITNAGFRDSWQGKLRDRIRQDPSWRFSRLEGPTASWITEQTLSEQRRLLPELAYRRLWLNEWTSGTGDALRGDDIDAAITLKGPQPPHGGFRYVAGLDLGLKRDASALVILGASVPSMEMIPRPNAPADWRRRAYADVGLVPGDPEFDEVFHEGTGRYALGEVRIWKPSDGRVSLEGIENTIVHFSKAYRLDSIAVDPWQAAYLCERLRNLGIDVVEANFTIGNLRDMATATLEAFSERRIDLWPHPDLVADLRSLRIKETEQGFRLNPVRDSRGHGDVGTALALALFAARRISPSTRPHLGSVVYH